MEKTDVKAVLINVLDRLCRDSHTRDIEAECLYLQLEKERWTAPLLLEIGSEVSGDLESLSLIFCKNLVTSHWTGRNVTKVHPDDKVHVLSLVLGLIASRSRVCESKHFTELLKKLVRFNFPHRWPDLLGYIQSQLSTAYPTEHAEISFDPFLLNIIHSVLKVQISKRLRGDQHLTRSLLWMIVPMSHIWDQIDTALNGKLGVECDNNADLSALCKLSSKADECIFMLLGYVVTVEPADEPDQLAHGLVNALAKKTEILSAKLCTMSTQSTLCAYVLRKLLKWWPPLLTRDFELARICKSTTLVSSVFNVIRGVSQSPDLFLNDRVVEAAFDILSGIILSSANRYIWTGIHWWSWLQEGNFLSEVIIQRGLVLSVEEFDQLNCYLANETVLLDHLEDSEMYPKTLRARACADFIRTLTDHAIDDISPVFDAALLRLTESVRCVVNSEERGSLLHSLDGVVHFYVYVAKALRGKDCPALHSEAVLDLAEILSQRCPCFVLLARLSELVQCCIKNECDYGTSIERVSLDIERSIDLLGHLVAAQTRSLWRPTAQPLRLLFQMAPHSPAWHGISGRAAKDILGRIDLEEASLQTDT